MYAESSGRRLMLALAAAVLVCSLAGLSLLQAGANESAACVRFVDEHELLASCVGPPDAWAFIVLAAIAMLAGLAILRLALADRRRLTAVRRR
jgi:hypothetical protein